MKQTTITLDGVEKEVDKNAVYLIDFSKLDSVTDLLVILGSMGISFSPTHPYWETIKKFANLDNPIYPNGNPSTPKHTEMKLPQLKPIK